MFEQDNDYIAYSPKRAGLFKNGNIENWIYSTLNLLPIEKKHQHQKNDDKKRQFCKIYD
jgi:hypothetical protein